MEALTVFLLVLLGICTGAMTSLIGASGVMILIPALSLGMKFTVLEAIGTSLLVDVVGSLAVSYTYFKNSNIDIRNGKWIALGSVAGAQLGAVFASHIPETGLGGAFGIFLVLFGVIVFARGANAGTGRGARKPLSFKSEWRRIAVSVIIGFLLGVNSGLLGAGGGINFLLVLLFIMKLPLHKAIGTSTLLMAVTALSGAAGHWEHIDYAAGLVIGAGTIAGGLLGARFANKVSEKVLGRVAGTVFAALGAAMTVIKLRG